MVRARVETFDDFMGRARGEELLSSEGGGVGEGGVAQGVEVEAGEVDGRKLPAADSSSFESALGI